MFNANTIICEIDNQVFAKKISQCPEIEEKNIFYVTGILSESVQNPEWNEILSMQHQINRAEIKSIMTLGTEAPQALQEYWQERDVAAVSDPETCLKITGALENSEENNLNLNDYKSLYFTIGEKYLILYTFKQVGFTERNTPPPLVLDEDFNIISELDLRKRGEH